MIATPVHNRSFTRKIVLFGIHYPMTFNNDLRTTGTLYSLSPAICQTENNKQEENNNQMSEILRGLMVKCLLGSLEVAL